MKRLMKALIVAVAMIGTTAQAVDPWYLAGNAALVADWIQTKEIARNPMFQEMNPVLGKNPSQDRVNLHFGAALLIYNGLYHWMDDDNEWKGIMTKAVTIVESAVVINNAYQGVQFKIDF